ncbi:hypothetical protein FKM82_011666 [Ascaphus truei]
MDSNCTNKHWVPIKVSLFSTSLLSHSAPSSPTPSEKDCTLISLVMQIVKTLSEMVKLVGTFVVTLGTVLYLLIHAGMGLCVMFVSVGHFPLLACNVVWIVLQIVILLCKKVWSLLIWLLFWGRNQAQVTATQRSICIPGPATYG